MYAPVSPNVEVSNKNNIRQNNEKATNIFLVGVGVSWIAGVPATQQYRTF